MQKSYFAENLKNLRKYNKVSLETLAEAIGVSKSAISDYENEKFSPTLAVCVKLVNFFGTSLDKMEFSKIAEKSVENEWVFNADSSETKRLYEVTNELEKLTELADTLRLELRLAKQKIESLQLQLQLHNQLKDSKLSEIELLKTQIKLLEDKIKITSL